MGARRVQEMCICKAGPTYPSGDRPPGCCFTGKSGCINRQVSCICPGCPVYPKAKLSRRYYCLRGT